MKKIRIELTQNLDGTLSFYYNGNQIDAIFILTLLSNNQLVLCKEPMYLVKSLECVKGFEVDMPGQLPPKLEAYGVNHFLEGSFFEAEWQEFQKQIVNAYE